MFKQFIVSSKSYQIRVGTLRLSVSNIYSPRKKTFNFKWSDNRFNPDVILLLLAGDQYWPRTCGGRFHFARTITYLLRHIFGSFEKGNKKNPPTEKTGRKFCLGGKRYAIFPSHAHANISAFLGTTTHRTYLINNRNKQV